MKCEMKNKRIRVVAIIIVILLATTWSFFRYRGNIKLRKKEALAPDIRYTPQLRDRFAIMYDFSHFIELMERCRMIRKEFNDYQVGRQKVAYVQVHDLIVQLHQEKRKFNTYMWEVRAQADLDQPVTRRQQRALAYYFHAINKMINDMQQVKRYFDYT